MRYPVGAVQEGDVILFRGILQKVTSVQRLTPLAPDDGDMFSIKLESFAASQPKSYTFHQNEVVLVLDRQCQEVTVL